MEVLPIQSTLVEYQKQNTDFPSRMVLRSQTAVGGPEVRRSGGVPLQEVGRGNPGRQKDPSFLRRGPAAVRSAPKVSKDILQISESELCGLRGMNLYLLFEGEEDCRRLSVMKIDPTTPSTFEVYLTFKQANAGWTFLPQFLKKITRGGTVIISTEYELTKKKLYRSTCE
ncbi:hypothetical protein NQ317_002829 [Molorchus minor]|uniref:Uncharacterized protein n=1 Tax=Molorchus minor TaxID=1323400 RepID=A0ABQ9JK35_9CUCU|nr:hypothetical protein NQ317_002829 [Molorchus minor]